METQKHQIIQLWPDGAPGSEKWDQVEEEMVNTEWDLTVVRNIVNPSLTVYPAENPNGAAAIVAPGGGFHFLSIEHEGRQVANWLAARGITAFILKYRVLRTGPNLWQEFDEYMANRDSRNNELETLRNLNHADAAKAIKVVRQRAAEWDVDPQKVGFMGFSAGGIVIIQLTLDFTPETRPDFAAPIYGVIADKMVAPNDAPPLFLLCAQDDEMVSRGSIVMYHAWNSVKLPVELHIYASGGHGFGMRKMGLPCDTWIERFEDWLKGLKII